MNTMKHLYKSGSKIYLVVPEFEFVLLVKRAKFGHMKYAVTFNVLFSTLWQI